MLKISFKDSFKAETCGVRLRLKTNQSQSFIVTVCCHKCFVPLTSLQLDNDADKKLSKCTSLVASNFGMFIIRRVVKIHC